MVFILAKNVRSCLNNVADPKLVEKSRRFFTEPVHPIGVPMRGCAKTVAYSLSESKKEGLEITKMQAMAAAKELYSSGILEEQFCANIILSRFEKKFGERDIAFFESIISNHVDNWACCDGLCSTLGKLYERYPKQAQKTKRWTKSKNRWVRRASAVCFVVPARGGVFLDLVYKNVSAMLYDSDDLVRKANGWALRQAGKFDEKKLKGFLERNADMPAITLSYAMEKLDYKTRKKIRTNRVSAASRNA